jgi:acyl-CoA thioester hydrolase
MTQDARLLLATYPLAFDIAQRYGDVDRQGHLNNVAIAEMYQEARLALLQRALGPALADFRIVVAEQTLRFLAEGFGPMQTLIGSGVLRLGRSSYGFAHAMFQGGRCIGLCDTALVNVGADGKAAPLPDEVRAAFEGLVLS